MTAPGLRSQRWFGGTDVNGFLHRAWIKAEGFSEDAALVQEGDEIELDVPARRLELHVPDAELARRRAPEGADFDFLRGGPGRDWAPYEPTSH